MEGHSKKYFRNISPKYHDNQPKICEICQSWKESRGHGKQQKTQSKTKQKQQKTYSSILGVLLSRKGMLGGESEKISEEYVIFLRIIYHDRFTDMRNLYK